MSIELQSSHPLPTEPYIDYSNSIKENEVPTISQKTLTILMQQKLHVPSYVISFKSDLLEMQMSKIDMNTANRNRIISLFILAISIPLLVFASKKIANAGDHGFDKLPGQEFGYGLLVFLSALGSTLIPLFGAVFYYDLKAYYQYQLVDPEK